MEPTLAVSDFGRLKRLPVDGFFYKHVRGVAPDDWTVGDGFERIETAAISRREREKGANEGCCFCCCAKIMRTGPFCDRAAARAVEGVIQIGTEIVSI
jgi:hypothetical protein